MVSTIGSRMLKSTSVSSTPVVVCWFLLQNYIAQQSVMSAYLLKPVLNGSSACLLALKLTCQVCVRLFYLKIVLFCNISVLWLLVSLGKRLINVISAVVFFAL